MISDRLFDIQKAIDFELNKYPESSREVQANLPNVDFRINHILVYFNCNGLQRELKILALYDLFRIQIYSDVNIRIKILQTLAHIKYNEFLLSMLAGTVPALAQNMSLPAHITAINPMVFKSYEKWLIDYRDFRSDFV